MKAPLEAAVIHLIVDAAFKTFFWNKRRLRLQERVRAKITADGGRVDRIGSIGMMLRNPFRSFGGAPVYLRVQATYASDFGCWFVRSNAAEEDDWVWKSRTGRTALPSPADKSGRVDNSVIVLPLWLSTLLYLLVIVGSTIGPFLLADYVL